MRIKNWHPMSIRLEYLKDFNSKNQIKLKPNTRYVLVVNYPCQIPMQHAFKTGPRGMGLEGLFSEIYKAYTALYKEHKLYGVYGHSFDQLYLKGISIDQKTKTIELAIGS